MNGALLIVGYLELTHDATIGYLHHYHLGGFAILHKHHMMATDGLDGVYLGSLGGSILPHGLTFLRHFGHTILMGHEDMTIGHQHGIAYLTTLQMVIVTPRHLSVFDNEHAALLALTGIEKVVTRQRGINGRLLLRFASLCCSY